MRQADRMAGSSVTFVQKPKESNQTSTKKTSSTKKNQQARTSVFERLGSPSTMTVQRTVSQDQSFRAGACRGARRWPFPGQRKKARTATAASSAGQRWWGAGGGSPGRLCPLVEKSAGLLSSHQHCQGWGGHSFSSMTSAYPSVHQLPGQKQLPGSPAGSGCPAGQGSHREGQQHDFSRVLQPAVAGSEKDRRPSSSNRLVHTEPAHGGVLLQDGNSGVRQIHHQKPGVDSLHRHSQHLSACPDAQGHKKVSAFCGQQVSLPVHLSPLWIGNFISGVHKATAPSRSSVKTARCQAAHLLRWLADPCRYSRTGPIAFPDDHQCAPVSRMDHQLRQVRSSTQSGLPFHRDTVQHSTVHSGAPAEDASESPVCSSTHDNQPRHHSPRSTQIAGHGGVYGNTGSTWKTRLRPVQCWAATAWCQRTWNWSDRITVPQWVLSEVAWWASPGVLKGLPLATRETEVHHYFSCV